VFPEPRSREGVEGGARTSVFFGRIRTEAVEVKVDVSVDVDAST
jgi:hypothetical protein